MNEFAHAAAHPSNAVAPVITRYFDLMAGTDKAAVIDVFAPDAVVADDGRRYRGRAEILGWLTGAASEFTFTTTRVSAEQTGETTLVVNVLEGDFPGGRVELRYAFELTPDGLIRALSITV
jgi:ketosteroid isomerase-like protein